MPLIYAFVARGTTVLAEHTGHSGNFATVAAEVRALLPPFCDVVAFFCVPPAPGAAPRERRRDAIATPSAIAALNRRVQCEIGARDPRNHPLTPKTPPAPTPQTLPKILEKLKLAEEVHAYG